jgi:uncharacterized protein YggE
MQMLKIVATAVALGCLCAPVAARAQDAPPATLTVTGQGRISRAPDMASVSVAIVSNDDNAAHALSENNRRYAALVAKLAANGIAATDIDSTSLSSYFSARPTGPAANGGGQLFGFVVTRSVEVNVNAIAQTGTVVDAATSAGATQINGVSFGFRDRRAVERAALAAAVTDAQAQAQAIASAAHVQIVRILRIGNEPAPVRGVLPMAMGMAKTAEAPVPTTISPSDLSIESSISITFVIR